MKKKIIKRIFSFLFSSNWLNGRSGQVSVHEWIFTKIKKKIIIIKLFSIAHRKSAVSEIVTVWWCSDVDNSSLARSSEHFSVKHNKKIDYTLFAHSRLPHHNKRTVIFINTTQHTHTHQLLCSRIIFVCCSGGRKNWKESNDNFLPQQTKVNDDDITHVANE